MSPKDTAYIVEHLAIRFMAMVVDYERQLSEHRAAFGARTEADAKIIEGLRKERDGLLTQVQDMRVEMERYRAEMSEARSNACQFSETLDASLRELEQIDRLVNPDREESTVIVVKRMLDQHRLIAREYDKAVSLCETEEQTPEQCIVSLNARIDRLQDDARDYFNDREVIRQINLDLRAEIAALQERLRASIARGDLAQIEVAAQKSQTPKQHPVTVGEWVRRIVPFPCFACLHCCRLCCLEKNPSPACGVGMVAKVVHVDDDTSEIEYDVKRIDGQHGVWFAKNCEPCDPPNHDTEAGKAAAEAVIRDDRNTEPKLGDTVRLVRVPTHEEYPLLETGWMKGWGDVGDAREVRSVRDSLVNCRVVVLDNGFEWPLSCIEVVRTEPMCVGDEVEVIGRSVPTPTSGMFTGTIAPIGT